MRKQYVYCAIIIIFSTTLFIMATNKIITQPMFNGMRSTPLKKYPPDINFYTILLNSSNKGAKAFGIIFYLKHLLTNKRLYSCQKKLPGLYNEFAFYNPQSTSLNSNYNCILNNKEFKKIKSLKPFFIVNLKNIFYFYEVNNSQNLYLYFYSTHNIILSGEKIK